MSQTTERSLNASCSHLCQPFKMNPINPLLSICIDSSDTNMGSIGQLGDQLFAVICAIVDNFRSKQRVRIIEFEQIHPPARISVAAHDDFFVAISSVDRQHDTGRVVFHLHLLLRCLNIVLKVVHKQK